MSAEKNRQMALEERRKFRRPNGTKEQRQYIRTETSVSMSIEVEIEGKKKQLKANTTNVSASGMMIEADEKMPVGTEAKIDLDTPGASNPVHCTGKIVWASPSDNSKKQYYGIEFTAIEEDNKNTFLKFLCDIIYKVSA
jgi:uncharacterized protein (TIGR02266 family)